MMRKTDIAALVLIAGVSVFVSYLVISILLPTSDRKEVIDTMEAISAEVVEPSKDIFNKDAINPTQAVFVGKE